MKLSIMQTTAGESSVTKNLHTLDKAARQAAAEQADILITPEMFLTGYNMGAPAIRAAAEPLDGHMLQSVAKLAMTHQIAILVGFPELAADGAIYNSAAFIDDSGQTLSAYRKTHLFGDVDRAQFTAGDTLCTPFTYRGWRFAIAICYDIEFPEVPRTYARAGTEIVLTPTANMAPFAHVARYLVPVRAQENSIYIAYANFVGTEGEFDYCGLSCICGPKGEDVVRAGPDSEALIFGSLSHTHLQEVRESMPYLQDLRTDLYYPRAHGHE